MLDMSSRKTLCLALVQPLFDYCCTAWHEGLSAKLKDRFDTERVLLLSLLDLTRCFPPEIVRRRMG